MRRSGKQVGKTGEDTICFPTCSNAASQQIVPERIYRPDYHIHTSGLHVWDRNCTFVSEQRLVLAGVEKLVNLYYSCCSFI